MPITMATIVLHNVYTFKTHLWLLRTVLLSKFVLQYVPVMHWSMWSLPLRERVSWCPSGEGNTGFKIISLPCLVCICIHSPSLYGPVYYSIDLQCVRYCLCIRTCSSRYCTYTCNILVVHMKYLPTLIIIIEHNGIYTQF